MSGLTSGSQDAEVTATPRTSSEVHTGDGSQRYQRATPKERHACAAEGVDGIPCPLIVAPRGPAASLGPSLLLYQVALAAGHLALGLLTSSATGATGPHWSSRSQCSQPKPNLLAACAEGFERATESRSLVQTIVFRKPLSKKVLLTQDFRKCSLRSHT